mgnify:CR=1 FL=1
MTKIIIFGFLILSLVFLSGCQNSPITKTLNPIGDASVDNNGKNYGGDKYLKIYDSTGGLINDETLVYLKFDLSNIPKDIDISSAKLKLLVANIDEAYNIGMYRSEDTSWKEFEINWGNKPSFSNKPNDIKKVVLSNEWYEWDVKNLVYDEKSDHITFVLKSMDIHKNWMYVNFYSTDQTNKEDQNRIPSLIIKYTKKSKN